MRSFTHLQNTKATGWWQGTGGHSEGIFKLFKEFASEWSSKLQLTNATKVKNDSQEKECRIK